MKLTLWVCIGCLLIAALPLLADSEIDSRWQSERNEGPHLYEGQDHTQIHTGIFTALTPLYWTAYQSNLDYVLEAHPSHTEYHFCDFDWDLGLRIEAGVCTAHDAWSVRTTWTSIKTVGESSCTARTDSEDSESPATSQLKPLHLLVTDDLVNFTRTSVRLELDYSTLDILVERPSFFSDSLLLTPFIGPRYARLDQHNRQVFDVSESDLQSRLKCKWNSALFGLGLHGGVSSNWRVCRGLSLYGVLGASVLAGRSQTHLRLRSEDDVDFINAQERDWRAVPGYNMTLGVQWERQWTKHVYAIFRATYEFHQWFNLSRMRRFVAVNSDEGEAAPPLFAQEESGSLRLVATGYVEGNMVLFHGVGITAGFHF